jgi:hypothetical protein
MTMPTIIPILTPIAVTTMMLLLESEESAPPAGSAVARSPLR